MAWRFVATKLNENSIANLGAPKVDRAGDVGQEEFPDFKFTTNVTYSQGSFSAFVQTRHIDSDLLDARDTEGVTISDNSVDSVLYTDAWVSWGRDLWSGARWEVYGSVTNLFDEDPPVVAAFSGFSVQATQTNPVVHDILGRLYTVGSAYQL